MQGRLWSTVRTVSGREIVSAEGTAHRHGVPAASLRAGSSTPFGCRLTTLRMTIEFNNKGLAHTYCCAMGLNPMML